jgi:hypothetical protein
VDLDFNLKTAKALGLTIPWTKAVNDIWLADQAFEGIARAIETGVGLSSVQRGKLAISELAEASLLGISKAIGGRASPDPALSGNGRRTFVHLVFFLRRGPSRTIVYSKRSSLTDLQDSSSLRAW